MVEENERDKIINQRKQEIVDLIRKVILGTDDEDLRNITEITVTLINTKMIIVLYPTPSHDTEVEGSGFEQLTLLIADLKRIMLDEEYGSWFALKIYLSEDSYLFTFNYDEENEWMDKIEDEHYAHDMKKYPRSEQHVPLWVRKRMLRVRKENESNSPHSSE